ncbi:MAG: hypothetical protein AB4038_18185 [Prochloraceae cyanobacterium]
MLSSILRPMVNTQIKLLAKSAATRSILVNVIAKWLGFLGVQAQVTHLDSIGEKIQVSLTVSQPEASTDEDWQNIVQNLKSSDSTTEELELKGSKIPPQQESKYQRILAYAIQISNQDGSVDWSDVYPKLKLMGIEESMLVGIKSALKVPQNIDRLVKSLDADVAAIALSQVANIALFAQQVTLEESRVLQTLIETMGNNC